MQLIDFTSYTARVFSEKSNIYIFWFLSMYICFYVSMYVCLVANSCQANFGCNVLKRYPVYSSIVLI